MDTNVHEVAALVSRVTMDHRSFTDGVAVVISSMQAMAAEAGITATAIASQMSVAAGHVQGSMKLMVSVTDSAMKALGNLATSNTGQTFAANINQFIQPLNRLTRSLTGLGPMVQTIPALEAALVSMATQAGNVSPAAKVLDQIGTFFTAASVVHPGHITRLLTPLTTFVADFANIAPQFAGPAVQQATLGLARIGGFLDGLNRINVDPAKTGLVIATMNQFFGALSQVNVANFAALEPMLARMSRFMSAMTRASSANLSGVGGSIIQVFNDLANINPAQMVAASEAMTRLGNVGLAAARLARIDAARIVASATAIRATMAILNSVPVTAGAERLSLVLLRLGNAMRGFSEGGGGAGIPTSWFGGMSRNLQGITSSLSAIPAAAMGSATSTAHLTQAFRSLYIMSGAVQMSLYGFRLSLLGIAILGITQFARLDDLLRRSMANMRDWSMESKAFLEQGLFGISSNSPVGATDLAKGLDIFTSSGYSAAAAMKALAIAEEYAVAGGVKVERSAETLLEIMAGFGKATNDPKEAYAEMKKLSDLLVGVAARVPATNPDDLARSFTGKFMTSARSMGMTIEDSMALIATYATVGGKSFKGSSGGNFISRALNDIMKQASDPSKRPAWDAILGESAFSRSGRVIMPVVELLEKLASHMGELGSKERSLKYSALGFEQTTRSVLEPLITNAGALSNMKKEMEGMAGISHKTAELLKGSLINQLKLLWNTASNAANVFGQHVAPAFYVVTVAIKGASDWFLALNPAVQSLAVWGSILAISFMPGVMVLEYLADILLSIILMPVHLLASMFMGVARALMMLPGLIAGTVSALSYLGSVVMSVFSVIGTAISTVWTSFFSIPLKLTEFVIDTVKAMIPSMLVFVDFGVRLVMDFANTVRSTMKSIFDLFKAGVVAAGQALMSVLTAAVAGFVNLIITLVVWVAMLVPMLLILPFVLATVGAAVATVALTIGQLIVMVGQGLVMAWNAFKDAAVNAAAWAGRGINDMNAGLKGLWANIKAGTTGFLEDATAALRTIAGFFWHFGHNVEVIWKYISKHGETMFADLVKVAFKFIEITASNLMKMLGAAWYAVSFMFKNAWDVAMAYVGTLFTWFGENYKNIWNDMGTVTRTFLGNFITNFQKTFGIIYEMVSLQMDKIGLKMYLANPLNVALPQAAKDAIKDKAEKNFMVREGLLALASKNIKFVDPMAGLPGLKTDFGALKIRMIGLTKEMPDWWNPVFEDIAKNFARAIKETTPFSGAFEEIMKSPIWQAMANEFNTVLPADAMDKAGEWIRRLLNPSPLEQQEMGTAYSQKGGPGMVFEQLSLSRTMLGGQTAETLEYQQLSELKGINESLKTLVRMQKGEEGVPVNPKPVVGD